MIDINVCRPYNIRFKKYPPILASNDCGVCIILHNNIFKAGKTTYPRGTFRVLYESTKIDFDNFERELDYFKDNIPYPTHTRYPNITSSTEYIQRYTDAYTTYSAACREDMLRLGDIHV